jgi:RNA polymerase sigma factor (sigma-70 family)
MGEDELVRAFVEGREAGAPANRRRAVAAWRALMAQEYDRVRTYVVTFRFPGHPDVSIPREDYDDAVQAALERCLDALMRSFRGTTMAELRAAVRTATRFACMDYCRERLRAERGLAGSLDDTRPTPSGEQAGRFDGALAEASAAVSERHTTAGLELASLATAIDQLPSEGMRRTLRLTMEGYRSAEIADRLGTSVANVDQLRSRALRRMAALRAAEEAERR